MAAWRQRILGAAVELSWIPALQKDTRTRNVHASTAIEGNPLTLEQVRALEEGRELATSGVRAKREVVNYFAGLRYVEKRASTKRIGHNHILELHRILAGEVMDQGEAGRYRTMAVRVGRYVKAAKDRRPDGWRGVLAKERIVKGIKNVHLSVHPPTGKVRIAAPSRMSLDTIRIHAISKPGWIRQQQRKLQEQERETPREYIDRESHYVWGRRYLLKVIESDQPASVEISHTRIILRVRPGADLAKREKVMEDWYPGIVLQPLFVADARHIESVRRATGLRRRAEPADGGEAVEVQARPHQAGGGASRSQLKRMPGAIRKRLHATLGDDRRKPSWNTWPRKLLEDWLNTQQQQQLAAG